MLVWAKTEVLECLARVLGAAQEEGVRPSRLLKRKLIERERLAACRGDTGASGGGESQGRHFSLGGIEKAVVVGHGANHDDRLLLVAILKVGRNAGERHGRAVDARHKEATKDDLVEVAVGAAGQETIELHQELEVDIVTGARVSVSWERSSTFSSCQSGCCPHTSWEPYDASYAHGGF
jgi:hypothetical protein